MLRQLLWQYSPGGLVVLVSAVLLYATGHGWAVPIGYERWEVAPFVSGLGLTSVVLGRRLSFWPWSQVGRDLPWTRLVGAGVAWALFELTMLAAIGWKVAIPGWHGFTWDQRLSDLDWLLFSGPPHRLTAWLTPAALHWTDLFYEWWFAALAVALLWQSFRPIGPEPRRFFLAMALTWVLLGGLAATLFASAGPCFYGLVTGDHLRYADLAAQLSSVPLLATNAQAMLWQAYTGHRTGLVAGISAFPSLHVAVPALYVSMTRGWWRGAAILFLLLTWVASFALGWHYAVDGLGGMLGAWGCWWLAGRVTRFVP